VGGVPNRLPEQCDVAIVGAGAAGLATAIFARRGLSPPSVVLLDGARTPGAKILVSGGNRCNVTNAEVTERDFRGGPPWIVRRILRAFPASETVRFFESIGVRLHQEEGGKLFPTTNRSRDVLAALLGATRDAGATLLGASRVTAIEPAASRFRLETPNGRLVAGRVVLATGGLSLPKSGSDGAGLGFARRLGHTVVPATPALVPLELAGEPGALHAALSGVALPAELSLWVDGALANRLAGPLLWTHFGISGPVVLDMSRHLLRARLDGHTADLRASFCPGESFDALEARWRRLVSEQPTATVNTALSALVPASMATALLGRLDLDAATRLSHLSREARRRLVHALIDWPLRVTGSRGYDHAEATAGGVPLTEIDPSSMASRACEGLYLVGEMLDVDGRLGGFNFQWAWSSAFVAGRALAAHDGC